MSIFTERVEEARRRGEGMSRPPSIAPPTDARPASTTTPRLGEPPPQPQVLLTGAEREAAQAKLNNLRTERTFVWDRTLGDPTIEDSRMIGKLDGEIATVAASIGAGSEPRPSFLESSSEQDAGAGLQLPRGGIIIELPSGGRNS